MLCHKPRGSSASAYSRPSEDEMREAYSKTVAKLTVYGIAPSIATVEDVEKQTILKHYELGIEDSPLKDRSAKQILDDEQRALGRPLSIDEQISALQGKYRELRQQEVALMEEGTERVNSEKHDDPQKVITETELEQYLSAGWQYVYTLPSGKFVIRK